MLSRLMNIEIHIVAREFCMPINHPERAYEPNIAGAPHMHIEKYVMA